MEKAAFQIDARDNVATALTALGPGEAALLGEGAGGVLACAEDIPPYHKVALRDIAAGEAIVKYGVTIGQATRDIASGAWVHLHNMRSLYDERSGHLDVRTGAPKDTIYE